MSERVLAPTVSDGVEDELESSLRPALLADFVGQERVKEQLAIALAAAKGRGEALDHVLLAGPPGLGQDLARPDHPPRARRLDPPGRRARRSSARATSPRS